MRPLRRVSVVVSPERAESARALVLELFPEGFEERDLPDGLELIAYTDAAGEERLWAAFGQRSSKAVQAGWEDRWREFHRPIRVGPLWVGPPWATPPTGASAVVIDPGRAFGTGGHPTTRLCLELLLEVPTGSLLDLGCGSGVLAIAASRLGFEPVIAVDHDPSALEASRRNARANNATVDVRLADACAVPLPETDVAVVNITAEVVRDLGPRLAARAIVASGYLEQEEPAVRGHRRSLRRKAGGWAADLFLREE